MKFVGTEKGVEYGHPVYKELDIPIEHSIAYLRNKEDFYLPIFYENDDNQFSLIFFQNEFENVIVNIKKKNIKIVNGIVDLKFEVIKNPKNLSKDTFAGKDFVNLVQKSLSDLLIKISEWEQKEKAK